MGHALKVEAKVEVKRQKSEVKLRERKNLASFAPSRFKGYVLIKTVD
jgi:hypothetical protein